MGLSAASLTNLRFAGTLGEEYAIMRESDLVMYLASDAACVANYKKVSPDPPPDLAS